MPKDGESLRLEIFADGGIWVDEGRRYSRRNDAVIQIPKGHGRLIDGDEVIERIRQIYSSIDEERWSEFGRSIYAWLDDLQTAPTILEAEE